MNEQIAEPCLKIHPASLERDSIEGLLAYCATKIGQGRFDAGPKWLTQILREEIERRSDESLEPGSIVLPNWSNCELADALVFFFVLHQSAMITEPTGRFLDEIFSHTISATSATLEFYGAN